MRILITGGVKSGKSRFALKLADEHFKKKLFLATAIPFDDEMKARIARHREERDSSYTTIEEPVYLDRVRGDNIILDDITVWLGNLLHNGIEDEWETILLGFLRNCGQNAIIITNETGWGNIPADPSVRKYNRYLGTANMLLAEHCDEVYACMAGIPLKIKP
ncbi:MAG: bifunctional adenosylcobinamide kinase/adenosylcobinamide-phosphate guanylyltransferase [Spirochaetales bacterium]|nr:MAG: bifunctional adenosylcobinamide kinase/adenosylcobinamide-phosphate guanylyltransferase [Spirochaetales bacterium]